MKSNNQHRKIKLVESEAMLAQIKLVEEGQRYEAMGGVVFSGNLEHRIHYILRDPDFFAEALGRKSLTNFPL